MIKYGWMISSSTTWQRDGNVVEDWNITGLEIGEAIVGLRAKNRLCSNLIDIPTNDLFLNLKQNLYNAH